YTYDSNGNQKSEKRENDYSWGYSYDYENRLIRVTKGSNEQVRNLYNGDGQLMGVIEAANDSATYYQYDGSQVIADRDGAGALMASYTRLPSGKLLDMYKSNG
ncbi:hypothetical protein, partial [Desulfocucumis palustris]|uniref:hypothetical protein n=1 Tax=Desulfocucumis palustris TaxID=1898651 RepID=UPI001A9A3EF9